MSNGFYSVFFFALFSAVAGWVIYQILVYSQVIMGKGKERIENNQRIYLDPNGVAVTLSGSGRRRGKTTSLAVHALRGEIEKNRK